ncbi:putative 1,4-alpha-glucan-branching enzyme 3, chloroplastic/amyloplastic-like [Capsicum annuum]|nr:putative 1,4-alpha-glucan-branching enzyme 3, chloroplastic/amyloplastic-like [Capsicum annuum]
MSSQTVNTVDDIFDSALNLEDTHYKEAYSEGYTDGLNSGKDEGNQRSIKQMDELLRSYPFCDPENESATDTIDSLRLKFRTICATLNIRLDYDGYPKASGIDKSGF